MFGWDFPVIKDLYDISSTCAVWAVDAVEFSVFTENVTDSVAVNPFCCKNNGCEITPCTRVFRQTLIVLHAHARGGI